jgi:hypothetical protein
VWSLIEIYSDSWSITWRLLTLFATKILCAFLILDNISIKTITKKRNRKTYPTPWSRVLPNNLTVTQLVKKFPAFYRTRKFITLFRGDRRCSLSRARCIQSTPFHPIFLRSILILSFPLTPCSSKWFLHFRFTNQITVRIFRLSDPCYMCRPSHPP